MGPNRHFRVTRAIQVWCIVIAFGGVVALMFGWNPTPALKRWQTLCVAFVVYPMIAVLGSIPKRLLPARCPACRRWRAWVYSEWNGAGDAWKYHCLACDHRHNTGVVWTYEGETQ